MSAQVQVNEGGVRARAGFIVPSVNTVIEDDLRRVMPHWLGCHTARVSLGSGSHDELLALRERARGAVSDLKEAQVDLVAFTCTAGSMVGGPSYDLAVTEDIRSADVSHAITTAGAMVAALQALGARSITFISPHQGTLHDVEANFFERFGFSVVVSSRMNLGHPNILAQVSPEALQAEIVRLVPRDEPLGDAIVLSCANMRALECVETLQSHFGVPVVGSNQAMIWAVLQKLGRAPHIAQLGRLGELRAS